MAEYIRPQWDTPRAWVDTVHLPKANRTVKVLQTKLSDFAAFPKGHPQVGTPFADSGSKSAGKNEWFPEEFPDYRFDKALAVTKRWTPVPKLKNFVEDSYRTLRSELFSTGGSKLVRNQPTGRINIKSIVREMQRENGNFDDIYQRRQKVAAKRPVLCMLAQGNPAAMWGNEEFIPKVTAAALSMAWAGMIMGCEVHAYVVVRMHRRENNYLFYPVITPYEALDETDLALYFHRDVFRWAISCMGTSHPEVRSFGFDDDGNMAGVESGYFVEAAKELFKPDILFKFGSCLDKDQADFQINPDWELEKMLDTIVDGIRSNKSLYKAA